MNTRGRWGTRRRHLALSEAAAALAGGLQQSTAKLDWGRGERSAKRTFLVNMKGWGTIKCQRLRVTPPTLSLTCMRANMPPPPPPTTPCDTPERPQGDAVPDPGGVLQHLEFLRLLHMVPAGPRHRRHHVPGVWLLSHIHLLIALLFMSVGMLGCPWRTPYCFPGKLPPQLPQAAATVAVCNPHCKWSGHALWLGLVMAQSCQPHSCPATHAAPPCKHLQQRDPAPKFQWLPRSCCCPPHYLRPLDIPHRRA